MSTDRYFCTFARLGLAICLILSILPLRLSAQTTTHLFSETDLIRHDEVIREPIASIAEIQAINRTLKGFDVSTVPHRRLTDYLLDTKRYNKQIRPVYDHGEPVRVHISMSLYQIIQVNEPEQNIKMNVWMIQSWTDEMLGWDPKEYGNITSINLPHNSVWLPDTYLYNSVVMAHDETERYMNVKLTTRFNEPGNKLGANMSFLYPAIYTVTCRLNVRYFPYDLQNCTLIISSWTFDASGVDYTADFEVNMKPYIDNEEWEVENFTTYRHLTKYACCENPWAILRAHLVIRRKPLYYLVNLIMPTSIITLVSITGFFTPASTDDDRTEKINLGITTLLAMSILMLMVSDSMPTTSEFVPLMAWFYLSIIVIVSIGTFLTTIILSIHARRTTGQLPCRSMRRLMFGYVSSWICLHAPPMLSSLWVELEDDPRKPFANKRKIISKTSSYIRMSESDTSKSDSTVRDNNNTLEMSKPMLTKLSARKSISQSPASPDSAPNNNSNFLQVNSARGTSADSTHVSTPRTPTTPRFRNTGMWGNALTLAGVSNAVEPVKDELSSKTMEMKRKRQCSLEWEYLATLLDRVFLILFSFSVIFVTAALMFVGSRAHRET